jgi:uncharacterized protein (DUF1697 family)
MATWIAFLRGINVGGKNRLPMKELKVLMEAIGFSGVQTYIQSGNIVFEHKDGDEVSLSARIATLVDGKYGFRPRVVVLSAKALRAAAAGNPFGSEEAMEKVLHSYFLAETPPAPNLEGMDEIKTNSESYLLKNKVLYLHTPDGFGRSKLAQRVEKLLGVDATARNLRTVTKVLEMAGM